MKPFKSIPGPKSIPYLGTLHLYLPFIGKYELSRLHRSGLVKYKEFGPLVRERIIHGVNLLFVFDPKDVEEVLARDGKFPYRRSHTALQKYRLDRPLMYSCGGLLPTNGDEWWRLRKEAQKVMTRIPCVRTQLPAVDQICRDFIQTIQEKCGHVGEIHNFLPILKKLFLELTMQTTVDHRFYCFSSDSDSETEASQLLWAADATNKSILQTDNGLPLWKWINTPLYKQLTKGQDTIYRIASKYVQKKEIELKDKIQATGGVNPSSNDDLTMLEYFILHGNLNRKDILTLVCDALLAGTDTSAFAMSFALYHLATNPEAQEKLGNEARTILSKTGGLVTEEAMSKATYTKAVLKESLRLNPISVGIGRIATNDFALGGYQIPKGTTIVTQNQVSCRLEEFYEDAEKFRPERWLDRNLRRRQPFLLLPFGHGPRACIGRRLAEQNIYCFLLQVMQKFKIEWKGSSDLDCYSYLINEPDSELKFKFTLREH